jgi:outer membrane protein OmpA-like peptidoglycan-associated protein
MRTFIQVVSLLSILSLSLMGLTGCGEKRLNVATLLGTPGEETSSSTSGTDTSGLPETSVEESSLTGQGSLPEEVQADAVQPVETINFVNEPSKPAPTDDSPLSSPSTGTPSDVDSGSSLMGDAGSLTPLTNGSDIATQSSSSTMNGSPQDFAEAFPFTAPAAFQDDLSGPQGGMEPIPDSFQVAKAEPSDMLREQLDKMKEEELAAAAAGLEDVFFQFDSWALTAEAKESLERDLKWLNTEPSSLLVIEGHADQRGTQAYNMVLGKRRAMAIQDYLFQLGVDPSRLSIISYGKDKPFCLDLTEVCHQLNRRGHLLVQN